MLGFQTISCLHDIPVVRSSTDKLQDVYAKAKDTSVLIRLPCNLVESVADKSLKVALAVVNPLVKPLYGPVRVFDDYAAQKIRQIETKYPAINTSTEDVMNTFNEKTEPVRNVMNSVKDTTTSTIQHGKDTVSNVATATVNKASDVANSVFSFCGINTRGNQRRNADKSHGCVFSSVDSLLNYVFGSVQTSTIWLRMLVVFFLLKIKQINDVGLNKMHKQPFLTIPQRLFIVTGTFLEYLIGRIKPDDRTLADLKKAKQQTRLSQQQQQQYFANRPNLKPDPTLTTRQNVIVTQQETYITRTGNSNVPSKPDYSTMTDKEELYTRLANGDYHQSTFDTDDHVYTTEPVDLVASGDIAQLHEQLKPTDVELLYSRLPTDILATTDSQEPLNADQQQLHAKVIGAELEEQGYVDRD